MFGKDSTPSTVLKFPSEIVRLSNMKHLHLERLSTPNTSWLVDAMLAMTALTSLYFQDESSAIGFVPTRVPTEIGSLTALECIDWKDTLMTGTFPMALLRLTTLTHLGLTANDFVGTIPTELGLLKNLNYLAMAVNKLTGFVPSEIGELSHLGIAEFQFNPLSPPVPPEACALGIKFLTGWDETIGYDPYSDGCE